MVLLTAQHLEVEVEVVSEFGDEMEVEQQSVRTVTTVELVGPRVVMVILVLLLPEVYGVLKNNYL